MVTEGSSQFSVPSSQENRPGPMFLRACERRYLSLRVERRVLPETGNRELGTCEVQTVCFRHFLRSRPARSTLAGGKAYFAVTSECVIAWTESAIRFCTPTLRISFAT